LDAALQVFDIGGGRTCCCERGDLAFDELARVEQFEWTRAGIAVSVRPSSAPGSDKNSGPDAHLDQSTDFQRNNGFAHRRAADAEFGRQLAFGRQSRSRQKFTGGDQTGNLIGDLPIQAPRLDKLQWHASIPPKKPLNACGMFRDSPAAFVMLEGTWASLPR